MFTCSELQASVSFTVWQRAHGHTCQMRSLVTHQNYEWDTTMHYTKIAQSTAWRTQKNSPTKCFSVFCVGFFILGIYHCMWNMCMRCLAGNTNALAAVLTVFRRIRYVFFSPFRRQFWQISGHLNEQNTAAVNLNDRFKAILSRRI